jgi:hypothetical protein
MDRGQSSAPLSVANNQQRGNSKALVACLKGGEGCRLTGPLPQDTRAKTSFVRPPTHPDLEGCDGIGRGKASRTAGLVPSAMVPRRRRRGAPPRRRLFVRRARPRRWPRRGAAPHDPQGARLSAPCLRLPRLPSRLAADDRIPHSLLPLRVLRRIGSLARFPKPVGDPVPHDPVRKVSWGQVYIMY